jgi:tripartite-type tricarboxylate transporter receptor subunit TctC
LIDLMIDPAANSVPQLRAGNIKAYAVTSRHRTPAAPDVPTVDEAGGVADHQGSGHEPMRILPA